MPDRGERLFPADAATRCNRAEAMRSTFTELLAMLPCHRWKSVIFTFRQNTIFSGIITGPPMIMQRWKFRRLNVSPATVFGVIVSSITRKITKGGSHFLHWKSLMSFALFLSCRTALPHRYDGISLLERPILMR